MSDFLLVESHAGGQLVMDGHHAALSSEPTLSQLVAERPGRARIFEKWNLGYCCGSGNKTLDEACQQAGIDRRLVMADLSRDDSGPGEVKRFARPTGRKAMAEFIIVNHHAFLRDEQPRLEQLANRIAEKHGEYYSMAWELQELVCEFSEKMAGHLDVQQQVLPMLTELDASDLSRYSVSVLKAHADLLASLTRLRACSNNFDVPPGACTMFRVLMDGLMILEEKCQDYFRDEVSLLKNGQDSI